MDWKQEWKKLAAIVAVFLAFYYLPVDWPRFGKAVTESLLLARWYAREHVLLCLVPAFFIAGAISVFLSQASVMKYLGPGANKIIAYGVASVSGTILAVCSCTVLPLFAGIWRMGAGLGPATAFLYSGPAINILAIILTARVLGLELGVARAVGAILFSVVIGVIMHLIYRKEETAKAEAAAAMPEPQATRPLWKTAVFFAAMIGILVFANWGSPNDYTITTTDGQTFTAAVVKESQSPDAPLLLKYTSGSRAGTTAPLAMIQIASRVPTPGFWTSIWQSKWLITALLGIGLGYVLVRWLGLSTWKVVATGVATAISVVFFRHEPIVPFTVAVIGLSAGTSTDEGEAGTWFTASWTFAKQILPLLLIGVLVAGFLLGRPGEEGLIPNKYVEMLVGDKPDTFLAMSGLAGGGGESLVRSLWPVWTNLFASVFGAFMYFATLTEVPILQGLLGSGMGKGPALALLLAGPALSLPSMLVIRSVMGTQKTVVYVSLVVVMATISGLLFGAVWG